MGPSASLFTSLYRYRENPKRSPQEDYLTECLRYLLEKLNNAGLTQKSLARLLDAPVELPEDIDIDWHTQYQIPLSDPVAGGMRPDLVGFSKGNSRKYVFVVESKIDADVGGYYDRAGRWISQLECYGAYARSCGAEIAMTLLLTHYTPPPTGWPPERTVWWPQVYKRLRAWVESGDLKTVDIVSYEVASQLLHFLEDLNMDDIEIRLEEIGSVGLWKELAPKIYNLGNAPVLWTHEFPSRLETQGFAMPRYNAYGEFYWEKHRKFSGNIYTPQACSADSTNAIFFMGTMLDNVYTDIPTQVPHAPEFVAGFGIWGTDDTLRDDQVTGRLNKMIDKLNSTDAVEWHWLIDESVYGGSALVLKHSLPFLKAYTPDKPWRDEADAFYRRTLDSLLTLDGHDISYLRDLQYQ